MSEQDTMPRGAPDPDLPPPLREVVWRWVRRATVVGVAASLAVHVIGLVVSAYITMPVGAGDGEGGGSGGGGVEMAIEFGAELGDATPGAGADLELPAAGDGTVVSEPTAGAGLALGLDPGVGDPGAAGGGGDGQGLGDISVGAGDIGGGSPGLGGEGGGGSGIGAGGTSFFGVEARGERFVYIVDSSGSMGVSGKIEALRRELLQSLAKLPESAQFLVIPFSDSAAPIGGKAEWVRATDRGKRVVGREIEVLRADGGTEPLGGFEIAFLLRPRPHAIYFMTDGEFDEGVANQILSLNSDWKVPVHCVCFVSNAAEAVMKRIAQASGGVYTFVPGTGP